MKLSFYVPVTENHIRRGKPESADRCPIALSLKELGFKVIGVTDDTLEFQTKKGTEFNVVTPKVAANFINKFDQQGKDSVQPFTFEVVL